MNRSYYEVNIQPQKGLSSVEIKHLLVALGVLTLAFAMAILGGYQRMELSALPRTLLISFLSVGTAFIFHELAHRKLARSYGCWAEFRMWRWGLMLALMFSFLFGFVFAAPGAVMIRGNITRDQNGKISAAGPATNWVVGTAFLIGSFLTGVYGLGGISFLLAFVAFVNLFIGGFNLLPLGPLDGRKIFAWSIKNYIILVILIGGTLAVGHYLGPFYGIL